MSNRRGAPRLLTRTLIATFATSAVVLSVVFVVMTVVVERSVQSNVANNLSVVQQMLSASQAQRSLELLRSAQRLAERPTLKAALDTYTSERRWGRPSPDLLTTLRREAARLARAADAGLVAILDEGGATIASGGALDFEWASGAAGAAAVASGGGERVVAIGDDIARAMIVPLDLNTARIGWLMVAERLDRAFAERIAAQAGTGIAILAGEELRASSLPPATERLLARSWTGAPGLDGTVTLGGETYAHRRILDLDDAVVYALGSIDAVAVPATRDARRALFGLAAFAFLLSAGASVWLARSITRPIDELSVSVQAMAADRDLAVRLSATGSSRELDGFTQAFNALMEALAAADAETRLAYVSAIRGLAATLDARDPYTAGHSERVSLLSAETGRRLGLNEAEIEQLRVGALLHDIGKIGVPDAILQKVGRLTTDEFDTIKTHTTLGARILKTVPFLAVHVPVIELHHERLDGRGYPYGLSGHAIPLVARIVHVADAYDAMTTARAYRGARSTQEAVDELWRCAGSDFDPEAVQALLAALPEIRLPDVPTPADRLRLLSPDPREHLESAAWERTA
jgi:putative nucleotidyltransferase with HDIG domain